MEFRKGLAKWARALIIAGGLLGWGAYAAALNTTQQPPEQSPLTTTEFVPALDGRPLTFYKHRTYEDTQATIADFKKNWGPNSGDWSVQQRVCTDWATYHQQP